MLLIENLEAFYGKNRFIDKALLVESFFRSKDNVALSDPETVVNWLKQVVMGREDNYGVYCIYNSTRNEALYVGKSKNIAKRLRQQLIGSKNRETGIRRYTRLFLGVIKKENNILEKEYNDMSDEEKKQQISLFNDVIYAPNIYLKICFTNDHIEALVLEETLIKYYKGKNQCKYNYFI
ncbi:MAG: GIY-YIG nuclease family protein [Candidatus Bathyarchaeota archaeon]|nr:GIY-YIG nuclease family protein [Candidatus Bathyarchaeota archaeon]